MLYLSAHSHCGLSLSRKSPIIPHLVRRFPVSRTASETKNTPAQLEMPGVPHPVYRYVVGAFPVTQKAAPAITTGRSWRQRIGSFGHTRSRPLASVEIGPIPTNDIQWLQVDRAQQKQHNNRPAIPPWKTFRLPLFPGEDWIFDARGPGQSRTRQSGSKEAPKKISETVVRV